MNLALALIPLFFIAIACGFLLGRLDGRRRQKRRLLSLSRNYAQGLNFLLGEQPDRAMETLVGSLDVNEHTFETHLALGRLFRKRGEIDRATTIHQNLLDSGELSATLAEDVELELARDYVAAGLYDRAEYLYQKMMEADGRHAVEAMRQLMLIFETEKDWNSALAAGEKLRRHDAGVDPVLAHYCCELACRLERSAELNAARRLLRRALAFDSNCVRASQLQGKLEMEQGNWSQALRFLKRIARQDQVFFDEVLDDIETCYRKLGREEELVQYLLQCSIERPSTPLVLKLAGQLRERLGEKEAADFMQRYLQSHPSLRGLREFVELNLERTDITDTGQLAMLQQLTTRLLRRDVDYQCRQCGFRSHSLHWHCPGCRGWATIRRQDPDHDQDMVAP